MTITPLDPWIKAKIGQHDGETLSAEKLYRYQTDRLKEVIAYVRKKSPFYRKHLAGVPEDFLSCPEDITRLPFTTEADLRNHYLEMLCVSQSDISRIVTLFSSGSTAVPKRLFFTDEDLELTVDFFHHGMTTLTDPGSRVMIFMPGKTPGSIGDLLKKGLTRMNSESLVYGPVTDPDDAMDALLKFKPHCLVGLPVQMLGLVRHTGKTGIPEGLIKSILLSADYVPAAIVAELESSLNVTVYEHYGMTEMGLGGGVQCRHGEGYHLREADLFFEVIDPRTGQPQSDGRTGEVVFTTLTRRGMPLVRYRTGDLAAFLPVTCLCGTSLRRLGKVRGRIAGAVAIGNGLTLSLPEMDEALFKVPHLLNYQPQLTMENGRFFLKVLVHAASKYHFEVRKAVEARVREIATVKKAVDNGTLLLDPVSESGTDWYTNGTAKRMWRVPK